MKKLTLTIISLFLLLSIHAQQRQEWEKYYDQLGDIEDAESESWENTYDELCELETHPINLNTATREELETLPFLDDQQIQDLCEYIYKYGGMKSWGELALISSLDANRQKLLTYFTTLNDDSGKTFPTWSDLTKYGRNEAVATVRVPFYERAGDKDGYLGYQYKHGITQHAHHQSKFTCQHFFLHIFLLILSFAFFYFLMINPSITTKSNACSSLTTAPLRSSSVTLMRSNRQLLMSIAFNAVPVKLMPDSSHSEKSTFFSLQV
jgi:DNA uptake protein ComE-like DNA-binding protein